MDIAHLLPILRRISSEHRALKLLLRESDQNWKTDVLRLQRAPKLSKDVDEQFREVVTSLQSGESDDLVIAKLINALDKTNLE